MKYQRPHQSRTIRSKPTLYQQRNLKSSRTSSTSYQATQFLPEVLLPQTWEEETYVQSNPAHNFNPPSSSASQATTSSHHNTPPMQVCDTNNISLGSKSSLKACSQRKRRRRSGSLTTPGQREGHGYPVHHLQSDIPTDQSCTCVCPSHTLPLSRTITQIYARGSSASYCLASTQNYIPDLCADLKPQSHRTRIQQAQQDSCRVFPQLCRDSKEISRFYDYSDNTEGENGEIVFWILSDVFTRSTRHIARDLTIGGTIEIDGCCFFLWFGSVRRMGSTHR